MDVVDPLAWIVTAPLMGFLLWARTLPEGHTLKRLRRRLAEQDDASLSMFGVHPSMTRRLDRALDAALLLFLAVGTAMSAASFAGATP